MVRCRPGFGLTAWKRFTSASYSFVTFLTFCLIPLRPRALAAFIFFFASFSFAIAVFSAPSRLTSCRMKNGGIGSETFCCRCTIRTSLSNSAVGESLGGEHTARVATYRWR